MCVCMYVHTYMLAYMYIDTYTCMHAYLSAYVHVHTYVPSMIAKAVEMINKQTATITCMFVCMYIHTYIHTYLYCIPTYTCTCTHIHTYKLGLGDISIPTILSIVNTYRYTYRALSRVSSRPH